MLLQVNELRPWEIGGNHFKGRPTTCLSCVLHFHIKSDTKTWPPPPVMTGSSEGGNVSRVLRVGIIGDRLISGGQLW